MVNLTKREERAMTTHQGKPRKELAKRMLSLMGRMMGSKGLKKKGILSR